MKVRPRLLPPAALLAILAATALRPSAAAPRHRPTLPTDGIALGASIAGRGFDAPCDAAAIDRYAALTGRQPAVVMTYQNWGEHYNTFTGMDRCLDNVRARGGVGMVTWDPAGLTNAPDPTYKLSAIARGDFDLYIRRYADDARAWGHPFFLRFAHEMNGNWYPWGVGPHNPDGNTPADYVAAWRHVHDLFAQEGAANVRWVWSPNTLSSNSPAPGPAYPGDAYVDWVGIDGYNVGADRGAGGAGWISLADLFGPTYSLVASLSSKPIMIAEMASVEAGGDKAAWITRGLLADIPARFPRIKAVIWFDEDKGTDWRVDSSPAALAAYRQVVASPLYRGQIDAGEGAVAPASPAASPTAPALPAGTASPTAPALPRAASPSAPRVVPAATAAG